MKIEELIPIGVLIGVLWWVIGRVRSAEPAPDPWSQEIEASVHQPDAVPVCHRCLTPQERRLAHWFCPVCGAAVGPYNNFLPYVYIFSQGEVLRQGTSGMVRSSFIIVVCYFLYSMSQYAIFAPVYWYYFIINLKRNTERAVNDSNASAES